jgi:hypothetical membrane protein
MAIPDSASASEASAAPAPANPIRRLGGWAGILGPLSFIAVFTIEGWLRPGYDASSMFISALSLGPRGWIQETNFIVVGVCLLLFALGVAAEFRKGPGSRAGPILLAIIGLGFLFAGLFVMDPVTVPAADMSLHSKLHYLCGTIVFTFAPISCVVFLLRFRKYEYWRGMWLWTLAVALIVVAAFVFLSVGPTKAPFPPNAFNAWQGIIQRFIAVPYLLWIASFGYRLLNVRGSSSF